MSPEQPVWRSLQYVPVHVEKYVATAHTRGADCIILDLEDSVPSEQKARARTLAPAAARAVGQAGADVLVRINRPMTLAVRDIEAVVGPGVAALSLPKVESAGQVQLLDEVVSEMEAQRGVAAGHTRFLVLIESAAGLAQMAAIAGASPRVVALSLGGEDFALDVGMEPAEETLLLPKQQLILAAAAAGIMALGVVGVATRFDDPVAYGEMARRSRRFGFVGSSCIHPSQIPLLNQAFSPTPEELAWASRIVSEAQAAERSGLGAFSIDGKMIDAPIVLRAQGLLARHAAIEARALKASSLVKG